MPRGVPRVGRSTNSKYTSNSSATSAGNQRQQLKRHAKRLQNVLPALISPISPAPSEVSAVGVGAAVSSNSALERLGSSQPSLAAREIRLAQLAAVAVEIGGLKSVHVRKAIKALVRALKAVTVNKQGDTVPDGFTRVQAAKQILSLANAYPSKQAPISGKVQVEVTMKPFAQAQVIDAQ